MNFRFCAASACILVFILLPAFLTSSCPMDSRVIDDEPGCDICHCCRLRTGEYRVLCTSAGLETVPALPPDVTYLNLQNNFIHHLDDQSFNYLPKLEQLDFGSESDMVVKTTDLEVFGKLPRLHKLSMSVRLEKVNSFLSSAVQLKELRISCTKEMHQEEYIVLFSGLKLDYLDTTGCNFELINKTFTIPPKSLTYSYTGELTQVDLNSKVKVIDETKSKDFERCLNFSSVRAEEFTIACYSADYMIVHSAQLDWADGSTPVNVKLTATTYINLIFGSYHKIDYLDLQIGEVPLMLEESSKAELVALNNTGVEELSIQTSYVFPKVSAFGENFLRQLTGTTLKHLEMEHFRVGRIRNLDFNLTTFVCCFCIIYCVDCFPASELRRIKITDTHPGAGESSIVINLRNVLIQNPNLQNLELQANQLIVGNLEFSFHPRIRRMVLETEIVPFVVSRDSTLNVSGLVNLKYLSIHRKVFFYEGEFEIPSSKLIFRLKMLELLDLSHCTGTLKGSLNQVFAGLDSLIELKMDENPFWGTIDRLPSLLRPLPDKLNLLSLTDNNIEHLPSGAFESLRGLTHLYLSRNQLSTLDGRQFSNNPLLTVLDIADNVIDTIDSDTVNRLSQLVYLRQIYLDRNRLRCSCENRELRDWMQKDLEKRLGLFTYDEVCTWPADYHDVKFWDYGLPWLACDFHKEAVIIGSLLLALALFAVAGYGVYYYRYDILFWWVVERRHRLNRKHYIHPERRFHAFLSYSTSEQLIAEYMFEELEKGDKIKFKIAYDCRDFKPGYTIAENIIRCIDESEKVIFLISQRFLEREWCEFEMNFAQMRCFDERKNLIILIFIQKFKNSQLPKRIRTLARQVNYLQYPDHANKREVQNFWHRLRLALADDSELETGDTVEEGSNTPTITGPPMEGSVESDEEMVDSDEERRLIRNQ